MINLLDYDLEEITNYVTSLNEPKLEQNNFIPIF